MPTPSPSMPNQEQAVASSERSRLERGELGLPATTRPSCEANSPSEEVRPKSRRNRRKYRKSKTTRVVTRWLNPWTKA
jgi:hypothetical protein